MNDNDFVNLYITNLVKEVEELTRTKIMLSTKDDFNAALVKEFNEKVAKLEGEVEDAKHLKIELDAKEMDAQNLEKTIVELRNMIDIRNGNINDLNITIHDLNAKITKMTNSKESPSDPIDITKRRGKKEIHIS